MPDGDTEPRTVRARRLPHGEGLPLPHHQTAGACGLDLLAAIPDGVSVTIEPGERMLVPTGLVLELPPGTEGQIRPRSGLAARHGITVLNSPGTIDSDYRGEVQVLLINHSRNPFTIQRADRIAQLVVARFVNVAIEVVDELSDSARGTGGFGSTGGTGQKGG